MRQKIKEKRVTIAIQNGVHKELEAISDNTGISMRKLVDMAVARLIGDPPTIVKESDLK